MKLIQDEEVIYQVLNGTLTVTNHRVRLVKHLFGSTEIISMTLDAIASCSITKRRFAAFLFIGLLSGAFGLGMSRTEVDGAETLVFWSALFSVLATLAYLFITRAVLAIASAKATIEIEAGAISAASLVEALEAVEEAKVTRRLSA